MLSKTQFHFASEGPNSWQILPPPSLTANHQSDNPPLHLLSQIHLQDQEVSAPRHFFSFQFYCDWGLCPMDHITSDSVKLETSWVWSTLTPQLQGHTVYHTAMQSKSGLVYSTLFLVCPLLRPECKWLFLGIWDWCWVRWQWPATRAHHDICCSVDSGWKTGPYLIRKLARKKRVVSVRINMGMRLELARVRNEISRGVYRYFQNGPTRQVEDITGFVLQVGYLSGLLWRSVLDGQWHGCILAVVE